MVLGKLRILAPTIDLEAPDQPYAEDGSPLTFSAMLEYVRRMWGDKVIFQQKARRTWTRASANDVYERSHQVAAGLIDLGLQPADRVALIMENGVDWLYAYYGIVLAGGVAVPMYYELKTSETPGMTAHATPRMANHPPRATP